MCSFYTTFLPDLCSEIIVIFRFLFDFVLFCRYWIIRKNYAKRMKKVENWRIGPNGCEPEPNNSGTQKKKEAQPRAMHATRLFQLPFPISLFLSPPIFVQARDASHPYSLILLRPSPPETRNRNPLTMALHLPTSVSLFSFTHCHQRMAVQLPAPSMAETDRRAIKHAEAINGRHRRRQQRGFLFFLGSIWDLISEFSA